jgi:hypothetical protein
MPVISDLRAPPREDYMPASTRKPEPKLHGMRSREDLFPAEPKIESFLTEFSYSARGLARPTFTPKRNGFIPSRSLSPMRDSDASRYSV